MLGSIIQKLRQEKGFSLTQLAERTEISKSYLSYIERNIQTNPSIEVLAKISAALDVDLQTLLSPNTKIQESTTNSKKIHVKNWSDLINIALKSGLINEEDIREIRIAIQKGKLE
ncbi:MULTISPECIES: helix-turn-helix domain-containing protein [unclassified Bacillus (in: firmicutes)]|uniref:helix-turn-helix domain-containing protein n=1 Tax=unclassified Bacillus (in: firmicutes) TaxID=185979 RepID=UPI00159709D7|nr:MULTISPECIES: helix-turn-helix transcriptional regulator [unclassified Bacillus (in: firmicutes)]